MEKAERNSIDLTLMNEIRGGDKDAFETLFRQYYPMLCAYAKRYVDLKDAEDLVQEMMLWVWENRERVVIESSVSSYLFKMTHHRALNTLTHKAVVRRVDTAFYNSRQDILHDVDYYQVEELTRRIERAISNLPESYQQAFVMHRFKDMSYKEIAELNGVSAKTIDYRIQQALKQLRIELKDCLPLLTALCIDI